MSDQVMTTHHMASRQGTAECIYLVKISDPHQEQRKASEQMQEARLNEETTSKLPRKAGIW